MTSTLSPMKLAFIFLFIVQSVSALTYEKIIELSKKEHDRSNLVKELKIYPNAREYKVTAKVFMPKGVKKSDAVIVKEKVVDSEYVLSEFTLGGIDMKMIVKFDAESKVYRKWFITSKNKEVQEFVGIAMDRSITWNRIDVNQPEGLLILMMETHTDKKTRWTEAHYKNGKLEFSLIGEAVKTK